MGIGYLSGRAVDQLSQSSAKVKERVELYLYSLSASSWCVQGELYILRCNDKFQYHSMKADNSDNGVLILYLCNGKMLDRRVQYQAKNRRVSDVRLL